MNFNQKTYVFSFKNICFFSVVSDYVILKGLKSMFLSKNKGFGSKGNFV